MRYRQSSIYWSISGSVVVVLILAWFFHKPSARNLLAQLHRERGIMKHSREHQQRIADEIVRSGDEGLDALVESIRLDPYCGRAAIEDGVILQQFGLRGRVALQEALKHCLEDQHARTFECRNIAETLIVYFHDLSAVDAWIDCFNRNSKGGDDSAVISAIRGILRESSLNLPTNRSTSSAVEVDPAFIEWWKANRINAMKWAEGQ